MESVNPIKASEGVVLSVAVSVDEANQEMTLLFNAQMDEKGEIENQGEEAKPMPPEFASKLKKTYSRKIMKKSADLTKETVEKEIKKLLKDLSKGIKSLKNRKFTRQLISELSGPQPIFPRSTSRRLPVVLLSEDRESELAIEVEAFAKVVLKTASFRS